jgi:hypothetical protein
LYDDNDKSLCLPTDVSVTSHIKASDKVAGKVIEEFWT